MKILYQVVFFVSFGTIALLAPLQASNFSTSKAEMLAILESSELKNLFGDNQNILGIWKIQNSYWVWGFTFRYQVILDYSEEGEAQVSFAPGIKLVDR